MMAALKLVSEFSVGQRFGELELLREVEPRVTEFTEQRQYLLRCDCGRTALRTRGSLLDALISRSVPACIVCLGEAGRGSAIDRHHWRAKALARIWRATKDLYSVYWEDRFVDECLNENGIARSEEIESYDYNAQEEHVNSTHLRALYPITSDGGWSCYECGAIFTSGLGCVACIEPICVGCHTFHAFRNGMTLEEVGAELGVTREEARRLESRALRKLRHPSRARTLAAYYFEYLTATELNQATKASFRR